MKPYLDYLPQVLAELDEIKEIAKVEDITLEAEWRNVKNIISDQWIELSTERGIKRREQLLNIQPFADDTLETRRFRIMARWNEKLPYTYRVLVEKLDILCGRNCYEMVLKPNEYGLTIKIELTQKRKFNEVQALSRRMIPANMVLVVTLRYNQHFTLAGFTHKQLSAYTHEQLRNEVLNNVNKYNEI
jgi:hypothetical protein